ncbi:hypothetical protein ABID56_001798 [Alkalibacillus flavidus]|uniref:Uncharacterized protein n=2 Tax=Alkalibacillus flavidus TaxID=546021 RepID=A0ABV2KVR8_9BACI
MQQSHGIGYQEYSQKLENRLAVERRREQEYQQSQMMLSEVDRMIHR